jgi:hypothetical protein
VYLLIPSITQSHTPFSKSVSDSRICSTGLVVSGALAIKSVATWPTVGFFSIMPFLGVNIAKKEPLSKELLEIKERNRGSVISFSFSFLIPISL